MTYLYPKEGLSRHLQLVIALFLFVAATNPPFAYSVTMDFSGTNNQPLAVSGVQPSTEMQLDTRIGGEGLLICSGKKSSELVDCKVKFSGRSDALFHTDLFKVASSGWRLVQVIPNEASDVWIYFFQK